MTTPSAPYEVFRIETSDHRTGEVEVYAGVVVEVSAAPDNLSALVPLLGKPWAEVSPRLLRVRGPAHA